MQVGSGPASATPSRRPQVLWLIKGLGLGGAERLLLDALPLHDREPVAVEIGCLLPSKGLLAAQLGRLGATVHCLGMRSGLGAPAAIRRLRQVLREPRIDLVQAHLPPAGGVARLDARGTGVPALYTEDNLPERHQPVTRSARETGGRAPLHGCRTRAAGDRP